MGKKRWIGIVILIVLICGLLGAVSIPISQTVQLQSAQTLQENILKVANQCAAVEGAYPLSLDYLVEHYNLHIDYNKFQVKYTILETNIAPQVTVEAIH